MGVISDVSITPTSTVAAAAATTHTITFTSSRASILNAALGAAHVQFGNSASGAQPFPTTTQIIAAPAIVDTTVPSAGQVDALAANGVFTHATQTLVVASSTSVSFLVG